MPFNLYVSFLKFFESCYLALGEVEDASKYFKRCLQSGSEICVDRKIVVEASDGLQKAQVLLFIIWNADPPFIV